MALAMHVLLGNELTDEEKKLVEHLPKFVGIREAYSLMTGDKEVRGTRITEATQSSDFPQALGTSMERRLVKEYSRVPITAAWKKFTIIDRPDNYKQQDLIRLGGLGDLPIVAENGTYTEYVSPSEEKASYNVRKRGKIMPITREMIKNDDLRFIQRYPVKMGQAAARTLAKFVFDLILNYGSGAINGGNIYDGGALYSAAHANFTASALDFDTLDTGITAMQNQTEADSNEPLSISPAFLLVAAELRGLSKVLIDSEKRPVQPTAGAKTGTDMSVNPNYKACEPIIIPKGFLRNDANNWYLIAGKADIEHVVVGFLDGRENPEVLLQDSQTVGPVFTNDQIRYKIRHEYSGVIVDFRGFYGGLVARFS